VREREETMPKPEELGRRIKRIRESRRLTLKAVEAAAGISATHISEIERGKTSPTLGALLRIARALGKTPAYFFEEKELGDVSRVAVEDRVRESLPGGAGSVDRLTTSIPGGSLQARYTILVPGGRYRDEPHSHAGNEAALVLSGRVAFTVDGDTQVLGRGDAIHFAGAAPHSWVNESNEKEAALIWLCTERGVE
jgi:transcriptional regulator with XRE-family HTH domain